MFQSTVKALWVEFVELLRNGSECAEPYIDGPSYMPIIRCVVSKRFLNSTGAVVCQPSTGC